MGQIALVVNRSPDGLPPEIARAAQDLGFDAPLTIGQDPNLASLEIAGRPTTELPADSPLRLGVDGPGRPAGALRPRFDSPFGPVV